MAKLNEQVIVVTISQMVPNNVGTSSSILDADGITSLQQVIQELVGSQCIVEMVINPQ